MPGQRCRLALVLSASLLVAGCGVFLLILGCGGDDSPRSSDTRQNVRTQIDSGDGRSAHANRRPNRLAREKSPYLLQHAHNPVDWYPWGEEAFAKARRENKPIFLSVGYSTCHWCHVMERESFENAAIARLLNEGFVCIKVDREERPDVDRAYMAFVQATTGGGGWPMSVWLTPELRPFFGGTYFPPESRGGRPGFASVLQSIRERWKSRPDDIVEASRRAVEELQAQAEPAPYTAEKALPLGTELLDRAYAQQKSRFDARLGGFGQAPKFPRPSELLFLHRVHSRSGDPQALEMSRATLVALADGGIHDQLEGGFHRYSTDAAWRVPHFEKMLYDQAQLVLAYLEMYQLTGESRFADVARGILDYVRRDLTAADGGFFSAEDADSPADRGRPDEQEEGAIYVWTQAEVEAVLNPQDAALVSRHYGLRPQGNAGAPLVGKNVLYVAEPLAETARALGASLEEAGRRLERARARLLEARSRRPRPHLDDKVLVSWNGLMISACARAAAVLHAPADLDAAARAADFVHERLWDARRRILLHRYRDGEAAIPGFSADYAFLVQGLLDLYEASFEPRWFDWARQLAERQIELFGDAEAGGFFETSGEDHSVFLRGKEAYDGAEPTSNSVTALNLLRLGEMTDSARYRTLAVRTLRLFTVNLASGALPAMMLALDFELATPRQIIIAGRPGSTDTARLVAAVHERFLPNRVLILADGGAGQEQFAATLPFLANMGMESGRATAYVCQNYACQLPVTSPSELAALLERRN